MDSLSLDQNSKEFQDLKRSAKRWVRAIVFGMILTLGGGAYSIWGIQQMNPNAPINYQDPFGKIIQKAIPVYEWEKFESTTELEERLLAHAVYSDQMTIRLVLVILRLVAGLSFLTLGIALLVFGLTVRQFLVFLPNINSKNSPTEPQ